MKIGILGAGQLSQMLALAAHPLGVKPHVLTESSTEPAWGAALGFLGNPDNPQDLEKFASEMDLLTFESEFFPADGLTQALKTYEGRIFPSLTSLATLQDRLSQKQFLMQNKIKTSPFLAVSTAEDLENAFAELSSNFVLKLRTRGYDGKGTFYARSIHDLPKLLPLIDKYPQGFIAEAFIKFRRELALMVFRSADGSMVFYPLVESFQKESRCDLVLGPVKHPGLLALTTKIKKSLNKINYIGAIAFELFDEGSTLSVNEIAPRVHNSGHYSQEALNFDQFTLHLWCGMGEKLPAIAAKAPYFGMVNLIGQGTQKPSWEMPTACHLHWYNKLDNRAGRKMGHLNFIGASKENVRKTLLKDRKRFQL
jgi:5-(carboxyamino)imidazole ribonucleotide synthase